jgi:hypothetical protein
MRYGSMALNYLPFELRQMILLTEAIKDWLAELVAHARR